MQVKGLESGCKLRPRKVVSEELLLDCLLYSCTDFMSANLTANVFLGNSVSVRINKNMDNIM